MAANAVLAQTPTNQPPSFTEGSETERSLPEDAVGPINVGGPVTATDPESNTLLYRLNSIVNDPFTISSTSGQIQLAADATLDYETDRQYNFRVAVSDQMNAQGNAETVFEVDAYIVVTVKVINVDEPGVVTLSSDTPQVDTELQARLTDPDRAEYNEAWQWQTAETSDAETWTDISGATSDRYTPVAADRGKYLRAYASYEDAQGPAKEASGTASNVVLPRPVNQPPAFEDGEPATRSLPEDEVTGTALSPWVTATDPDIDELTYSRPVALTPVNS